MTKLEALAEQLLSLRAQRAAIRRAALVADIDFSTPALDKSIRELEAEALRWWRRRRSVNRPKNAGFGSARAA